MLEPSKPLPPRHDDLMYGVFEVVSGGSFQPPDDVLAIEHVFGEGPRGDFQRLLEGLIVVRIAAEYFALLSEETQLRRSDRLVAVDETNTVAVE
jgi:hypothetical protein